MPNGLHLKPLLRILAKNVLSITRLFSILPLTNKFIIGNFNHLTNSMLFAFLPLSCVNLSSSWFSFSDSVHFFAVLELAAIVDFGCVEDSKSLSTIEELSKEVFILFPKVKSLPMKKVILEIAIIVFILRKYLQSKSISPSFFKCSKV